MKKNRYLFEHVIMGIAGYGNCIGVPVVRGEAYLKCNGKCKYSHIQGKRERNECFLKA
ncbi:MAG: Phosphoribosylformylglycinamidine (FGAM) synthase, synthetase domain [Candidatus Methanomarinus sp.]|nr:MAG: Phosphoribosylformylglycinamidine (FGAM) synthase, synthetase domain [ANME-2 cluster archaeon]